jgi:Homeodomain-like domain
MMETMQNQPAIPVLEDPKPRSNGRMPDPIDLDPDDAAKLEEIVSSGAWPEFQVRRAKAILAIAKGAKGGETSKQLGIVHSTLWRYCKQYREEGLVGLLTVKPRLGRPKMRILPWNDPLD